MEDEERQREERREERGERSERGAREGVNIYANEVRNKADNRTYTSLSCRPCCVSGSKVQSDVTIMGDAEEENGMKRK